jgi:hypothetical protein
MAIFVLKNTKGKVLMETDYTSAQAYPPAYRQLIDYEIVFFKALEAYGYDIIKTEQLSGMGAHINVNEIVFTTTTENRITTHTAVGLGCLSMLLYCTLIWGGVKFIPTKIAPLTPAMICTAIAGSALLGHYCENSDRRVLGLPIVDLKAIFAEKGGRYLRNTLPIQRAGACDGLTKIYVTHDKEFLNQRVAELGRGM